MARLILITVSLVSALAAPASAGPVDGWAPQIAAASARCRVPILWIERVMHAESRGQTTLDGRPIVSRAGAMGLMQLMPATWAEMRARLALGNDPHDPADNIVAGACYLRLMHDRFGYPGLFGAYNAGPGRYAAYLAGERGLPAETRAYVSAVGGRAGVGTVVPVSEPVVAKKAPGLFFVLSGSAAEPESPAPGPTLFVNLAPER